jgi:hypothetical protein
VDKITPIATSFSVKKIAIIIPPSFLLPDLSNETKEKGTKAAAANDDGLVGDHINKRDEADMVKNWNHDEKSRDIVTEELSHIGWLSSSLKSSISTPSTASSSSGIQSSSSSNSHNNGGKGTSSSSSSSSSSFDNELMRCQHEEEQWRRLLGGAAHTLDNNMVSNISTVPTTTTTTIEGLSPASIDLADSLLLKNLYPSSSIMTDTSSTDGKESKCCQLIAFISFPKVDNDL